MGKTTSKTTGGNSTSKSNEAQAFTIDENTEIIFRNTSEKEVDVLRV